MVDLKMIEELVQLMIDHALTEISLRDGAEEVNLKRPGPGAPVSSSADPRPAAGNPHAAPEPGANKPAPSSEPSPDDGLVPIRSPMVGTFYSASHPETPPYVQVGSRVTPDTVVCVVEAMKVFNEIKAEVSGTVEQLLAENEQAVEYGQELFLVRASA
ncbi:MAG: acetyl-CoA carboxylase biotin carboxyl carrier protein [Planctomycetota bacterium]